MTAILPVAVRSMTCTESLSPALPIAAMRFHAAEAGLLELDGPIVGVVSGGNVDPDRYRAYLEAPIPPDA